MPKTTLSHPNSKILKFISIVRPLIMTYTSFVSKLIILSL